MRYVLMLSLLVAVPTVSFARDAVPFERECREELGIGQERELQPGPTKAALRECIRDHVSAERSAESASRTRSFIERRGESIFQRVIEEQSTVQEQTVVPAARRAQYDRECREQLDIGVNEVVQPGPKKGTLLRCVERKTSQASREADLRRRRTSVQQRQESLHQNVLQQEQQQLQNKLEALDAQKRARLQKVTRPNPRTLRDITSSARASVYSQDRDTTRTDRRSDADKCRAVAPEDWGDCIREALNSDSSS